MNLGLVAWEDFSEGEKIPRALVAFGRQRLSAHSSERFPTLRCRYIAVLVPVPVYRRRVLHNPIWSAWSRGWFFPDLYLGLDDFGTGRGWQRRTSLAWRPLRGCTVPYSRHAATAGCPEPPLMPRTRAFLRRAWVRMTEWVP